MKNTKRITVLLMLLVMVLGLFTGCGGNKDVPAEEPEAPLAEAPADESTSGEELEMVSLPTPTVFFGEKPGLSIPQWDEFIFENDPRAAVLAYVELLQSAYGLTLIEQSEEGDQVQWELQYQDNDKATISISVGPFYEKTKVDIMYSSAIRWQDGAVFEWPEPVSPSEPVPAPDPEFYLNTGAVEKGDNSMTFILSEAPGVIVFEYISALKNSYGMTEVDSYTEAETWQWCLQKGEDENATVSIGLDKRGDGDWDLSFIFGENVTLLQAETRSGDNGETGSESTSTPTVTPTPEPTPTPTPEPEVNDPSALPDFLANDSSGKFYMLNDSRVGKATYKADSDQLKYVAEDYMNLLAEMGYTVVYEYDKEYTNSIPGEVIKRDFYHSGVDADAVLDDSKGQVRVHINTYTKWNETHVAIFYSDGITMENFSGGSGSSDSSNDFWDECSACHGSGDCTHCGGDDKVKKFQAGIGWVEQNCTFCSGGRCPTCGGTGKP